MTNIKQLLTAADPLRNEMAPPAEFRGELRRAVIVAASGATRQKNAVSRRFVMLAGAAAVLSLLATSSVWMPSGTTLHAAVRFEVRLAEQALTDGMHEAVDAGSGRLIYLHQELIVTNDDIAETRVIALPSGFGVEVDFTEAGAAKMRSVTRENVGRLLAIVVNGSVLAAPRIASPIDQIGVINGDFTRETAERLARGLLG